MLTKKKVASIHKLNQRALRAKDKEKRAMLAEALGLAHLSYRKNRNSSTTLQLGRILLHNLKFTAALRLYRSLLKAKNAPARHAVYNGIGNAYRYMATYDKSNARQYKLALHFNKKALASAPINTRGIYWSNLAITCANLKQWDDAIKAAKKSIHLLRKEEKQGIKHGNQIKILQLEIALWGEYKKRTLY